MPDLACIAHHPPAADADKLATDRDERCRLIAASIIIPVLNEAEVLDNGLSNLFADLATHGDFEVIISDGGSTDETLEIAKRYPCRIIHGNRGRAAQMNAASKVAHGAWLLFLHADSRLPDDFEYQIKTRAPWGFFRLRLSGDSFIYRIIESAINLRSRLSRVAGGDQGLYFEKGFFETIGGYPSIPLMEDIAICKHARRLAGPTIDSRPITSSSRRWQQNGVIKTIVLMWSLRLAFWLGVDPFRLHRMYYPQREQ